jgi:acyl-CoA thioesterase-1
MVPVANPSIRRVLAILLLACCVALPAAAAPTILVWGDSLSAGYGLDANTGWVHLLEQRLQTQGERYVVVNGSVSGETTSGGLARLPAALARERPDWVLIELGANDGLRGLPLSEMRDNLTKMTRLARAAGAKPVLFEMRLPTNFGPIINGRFRAVFADVAKAENVPLVPFFLEAVATDPRRWFQDDGIHPNAQAQPRLLDAVWASLAPLLRGPGASRRRAAP